jgi:hypothetical protein
VCVACKHVVRFLNTDLNRNGVHELPVGASSLIPLTNQWYYCCGTFTVLTCDMCPCCRGRNVDEREMGTGKVEGVGIAQPYHSARVGRQSACYECVYGEQAFAGKLNVSAACFEDTPL